MNVYKYDIETKEFLQELEINEAYGTNIPFTTTIKPLAKKEGFAVCFNSTKWEYIEDNRGKTIYEKATKEELKVNYLGKIKDDVTILKPEQFDIWDNILNKWVCDEKLKEEERKQNIQSQIDILEAKTYRPLREMQVGTEEEMLQASIILGELNEQIKTLRNQL
ncbi:hypothetical protein ACN9J3_06125 [Aliarcobacter butzleri]|uniref:hypothetical protein n=1 Tax=Aliarcobacter butzleri TaxID=28197 RepID=UPI003B227F43